MFPTDTKFQILVCGVSFSASRKSAASSYLPKMINFVLEMSVPTAPDSYVRGRCRSGFCLFFTSQRCRKPEPGIHFLIFTNTCSSKGSFSCRNAMDSLPLPHIYSDQANPLMWRDSVETRTNEYRYR